MTRALALIALTALLATGPAARAAGPPLGVPVPEHPTASDLLSTSSDDGDVDGVLPGAGACQSAPHRSVELPADDAPHNDTGYIEYWWWTGHLVAADGHRFAFMLFFASKPSARVQYVDYTLSDLSTGRFHYGRQPVIPGRPPDTTDGFRLAGRDASAVGGGGRDRLRLRVDGYSLDLSVRSVKPPVIELGDGYVSAYCNTSYYYARVRMTTRGWLRRGGSRVRVTGTTNFDRQWGFTPALEVINTSYFSAQLADGRDIFVGIVRLRRDGEEATLRLGSISDAQGHVRILHARDFTVTPTGYWRRDASCSYPVRYDIDVDGLHLRIRPSIEDAEVRATPRWPQMLALWPWAVYWDGETQVTGDATGRGWLDLAKYCPV